MKKKNSNRSKTQPKHSQARWPNAQTLNNIVLAAQDHAKLTCKILEFQEMEALEAEQAGQLTDKFCYEYTDKDGKPVRGICAVGVREAIRFCKIKPFCFIPKFRYEREDLGDGWYREVVICTNPHTKEETRSTCQWQRGSRFSDRTAVTIAERNAMLKHLPAEIKMNFINYCVKRGFIQKADVNPALPAAKEAAAALPDAPEQKNEEGKEITAGLARIYAIGHAMGIKSDEFRIWLHKAYKIDSMKKLNAETINAIVKGLAAVQNNVTGKSAKVDPNIMTPAILKNKVAAANAAKGATNA